MESTENTGAASPENKDASAVAAPAAAPVAAPVAPEAAPAAQAEPAAKPEQDEGGLLRAFQKFMRQSMGFETAKPADIGEQIKVAFSGDDLTLAETLAKETGADSLRAVQLAVEFRKERDRLSSESAAAADSAKALEAEKGTLTAKVDELTAAATAAATEIASLKEKLAAAERAKADAEKAFTDLKGSGYSGNLNTGAPGAGVTTKSNPWLKGQINLTQQHKITQSDPELAKSLKLAAGVK